MVTLTASVTLKSGTLPSGVHFGGSITFMIASSGPVTVPLKEDGPAEYPMCVQALGEITITAEYAGDGNYHGSSGGPVKLVTDQLKFFLPFVGR